VDGLDEALGAEDLVDLAVEVGVGVDSDEVSREEGEEGVGGERREE